MAFFQTSKNKLTRIAQNFKTLAKSYRLAVANNRCSVLAPKKRRYTFDVWKDLTVSPIQRIRFMFRRHRYRRSLRTLAWVDESGILMKTPLRRSSRSHLSTFAQMLLLNQANNTTFGHPYHLVNPSFLPLQLSFALFQVFFCLLLALVYKPDFGFTVFHGPAVAIVLAVLVSWVSEVLREEQRGAHTLEVQQGFRLAILLFIASELMLFVAFFWAVLHSGLNPSVMLGNNFMPNGVAPIFWGRFPLASTWLLLMSGLSLTIGHRALIRKDNKFRVQTWLSFLSTVVHFGRHHSFERSVFDARIRYHQFASKYWKKWTLNYYPKPVKRRYRMDGRPSGACGYAMNYTLSQKGMRRQYRTTQFPTIWVMDAVLRGVIFLTIQAFEYIVGDFNITDSIYGTLVYSLTGLHGFHVFVGVLCLFTFVLLSVRQYVSIWFYQRANLANPYINYPTSYKFEWYSHRVAFEGAVWYWHFVDVVWIAVVYAVYAWPFDTGPELQRMAYFAGLPVPGYHY